MGNGNFTGGKFNLTISFINHSPSSAALARWHKSFELASKVLHTATLGQSQFGKIRLRMNAVEAGSHDDIFIWDMDADDDTTRAVTSPASVAPFSLPNNAYTRLFNVHQKYSFVITHEFGHLAFDLGDEYTGPSGHSVPSCRKTLTPYYACIMEFSRQDGAYIDATGQEVTADKADQFCSYEITGHDTTTGTSQQAAHPGKSCWDVISSLYADIKKPNLADMPDSNPYEPIEWISTNSFRKHVFAMVGATNLQGTSTGQAVKNNALFTANYLVNSQHQFGVVSANPDAKIIVPLGPVNHQNIGEITGMIQAVNFQPSSQFSSAISMAANMHREGPADPDHQSIMITSPGDGGVSNAKGLFDDLVRETTFLHASLLSEGPLSKELHDNVANRWSSHYVFDNENQNEDQALGLQCAHIQMMFETDGHQLVGYKSGRLAALELSPKSKRPVEANDKSDQQVDMRPFANFETRSFGFDYPVLVEEGSRKADFLVSVLDNPSVELEIVNPNGELIGKAQQLSDEHTNTNHYHWYSIKVPMPGRWIMRLRRIGGVEPIAFRLLAYSEHPEIHARFFATSTGKKVRLMADVSIRGMLYNLEIPVVEIYDTRHHGTQLDDLKMKVALEPTMTREAGGGSPIEIANGTYEKEIEFEEFGSFTAVLRIANAGTAVYASNSDSTLQGNLKDVGFGNPIPNFVRFLQIPIRLSK